MYSVLLVREPGVETAKLAAELKKLDCSCLTAANEDQLLEQMAHKIPEILLLGIPPSRQINELSQHLKTTKKTVIIFLTTVESLPALPAYADDFVCQPYRAGEIIYRAKRASQSKIVGSSREQIVVGNILIDTAKYETYLDGKLIELTFKEYELLKFLATNPGRVFTRDALLNQVWGSDYFGGDRTVDVHIRRLRGKIEDASKTYIDTVRNIGYRFKKV